MKSHSFTFLKAYGLVISHLASCVSELLNMEGVAKQICVKGLLTQAEKERVWTSESQVQVPKENDLHLSMDYHTRVQGSARSSGTLGSGFPACCLSFATDLLLRDIYVCFHCSSPGIFPLLLSPKC
jgi:hypothetical protein